MKYGKYLFLLIFLLNISCQKVAINNDNKYYLIHRDYVKIPEKGEKPNWPNEFYKDLMTLTVDWIKNCHVNDSFIRQSLQNQNCNIGNCDVFYTAKQIKYKIKDLYKDTIIDLSPYECKMSKKRLNDFVDNYDIDELTRKLNVQIIEFAKYETLKMQEKDRIDKENEEKIKNEYLSKVKIKQDIDNINREKCLSKGDIGICQGSSVDYQIYVCGKKNNDVFMGRYDAHCYATDEVHVKSTLEIRNNTNNPIKDIVFYCYQFAKSGTRLKENMETIYDSWDVNEIKKVELEFYKHSQVQYMECNAVEWVKM